MSKKILVTGATGTIGGALVKQLQAKHVPFVAGVRNVEQAKQKLNMVTDFVTFDFADPSTFEKATNGVDRVFLLGPPLMPNLAELLSPFVDFLKSKNILRVVYISAMGIDQVKEMPFHTIISKKLQDENFDYTILKPSFLSQNFKNYEWDNIQQHGIVYSPAGNGQAGFVDVNDIGAVAAEVLTGDGHSKKTYELTGPELLSYHDAAALLTEVTGRPIAYPNPSPEEYIATLKSAGVPDFIAPYMILVYSMIDKNLVNKVTGDVERITGKKPIPLKQVLVQDFS